MVINSVVNPTKADVNMPYTELYRKYFRILIRHRSHVIQRREISAIYCKAHTKSTNTMSDKLQSFLRLQQVVDTVTAEL
jgi:hypothetical protein